ncbi:MAG: hypothetical protein E7310_05350 [Clostridiales bacterium]|nr:hypothetical protein [Clostridiales bacterium]
MNTFKFERKVIVRLDEMISRLNSVLEKRIVEVYTSNGFMSLSNDKIVDYVFSHKDTVDNLAAARRAREFFETGEKLGESSGIDAYLKAAFRLSSVLSELSVTDSHTVQCKVSVSPALKAALNKAENTTLFKREAGKVCDFVYSTPTNGWCWVDMTHNTGTKNFGLVRTEKNFKKLLDSGYEEITSDDLCGIRIAYKYETEINTKSEKEKIINVLSEGLLYSKDNSLIKSVEILYPDHLHHGTYKIFIPDVQ